MSDRPSQATDIPDEPEFTGGWSKPKTTGGWFDPKPPSSTETDGGWRVPAMPADLAVAPESEGEWHLPRPEDTLYSPEDVIEIGTTPAEAEVSTEDLAALTEEEEAETEAADDDDDAFSMSELIALASLAEEAPRASITPGAPVSTTIQPVSTTAATTTDADDPAAYARRQLELLSGAQPETTSASTSTEAAPTTDADDPAAYAKRQLELLSGAQPAASDDPAAYARQQLEQLGGSQPIAQPAAVVQPQVSPMTQRFQETEEQARSLYRLFQAGQITNDQLQAQLKQLMILDESNVWWMMGVQTDTWYYFDTAANNWVAATPPPLASVGQQSSRQAVPTETSSLDPSQVLQGSLPYLPSEPVQPLDQTQITGLGAPGQMQAQDDWSPQSLPVRDTDHTMVSPAALDLTAIRRSDAPTLDATQVGVSQPTVVAQPVDLGAYVEAPNLDVPPDYSLDRPAPTYEDALIRQKQSTVSTLVKLAVFAVVGVIGLAACTLIAAAVWYSSIANEWQDEIAALANYQSPFQTVRILDMNGEQIAEINSPDSGARTSVSINEVSPFMIHAVVSLENERFFVDPGWDIVAIARAFLQNLGSGQVESGASTITQQIARQLILRDTTVSPERKLTEIIIAAEIGKQYDKNFILELYLNEIFFGNQSYGVEAASEFYFDEPASDLNLAQAAFLAGIISSPAVYDPVRRPDETQEAYGERREATLARMNFVINRMSQVGCIEGSEPYVGIPLCVESSVVNSRGQPTGQTAIMAAEVSSTEFEPREFNVRYPHFIQYIQARLESTYGSDIFRRGFIVRTTLNPQIQDIAQQQLSAQMQALQTTGINTGAVMVTDPRTGAIRAMVGSPNFSDETIDGQVNNTLTWQQPGSSIKPVVYTTSFEGIDRNGNGVIEVGEYYTPATVLWDVPTTYSNGQPISNYDGQYRGPLSLRSALQGSINIPAVKTYEFIGNDRFVDTATRMGLTFLDGAQFGPPTGIGATEVRLTDMMEAYGTLATGGQHVDVYSIESITDRQGIVVPVPERLAPTQAIQPQIAYLMQNILSDDAARAYIFGANGPLTLGEYPGMVAAKTGTSNDSRDLWTMGFTTNVVVGVWIGNVNNDPTFGTSGTAAAPIWNAVMREALLRLGRPSSFPIPSGIVAQPICADTGTVPPPNCTSVRNELFYQSQPPPPADQAFVQSVAIDTWSGLRANEFCPDNIAQLTFANITDQFAVQWLNSPAGQPTAQRLGLPIPFEIAPQDACSLNNEVPIAALIQPTPNQTILGNVQIVGRAVAAQTFSRFQLEVASAATPDTFTIIAGPFTTQQPQGVLGTWDTATVPNGGYILRLAMFAQNGGYLYRTTQVNVNNPLPTATPFPTTTPFPTAPPAVFTPLPFDTPVPIQVVPGGPTPTATINPGG